MKIVVAVCILLGLFVVLQYVSPIKLKDRERRVVKVGENTLMIEVVTAPSSIQKGLGGRTTIGSDGMLFVFPQPQVAMFWMKDMVIDLDFVWLRNRKVVDLTERVPAPRTVEENADAQLKIYRPKEAVDMVLELPAGSIQERRIRVGDTLKL